MAKTAKQCKQDIIKKLNSGEYVLVKYVPKPGSDQHVVWNTFRQIAIVHKANEPIVHIPGLIACVFCKWKLYAWNKGQGGFTSPMKHVKEHTKQNNQPTMHNTLHEPLSTAHKKIITRSCEDFILLDLRPFKAVEGEGFISLCQSLINIGVSRKHKVTLSEVKQAVPVATTISRRIVARLRRDLKQRVQGLLEKSPSASALTFDGWTDKIRSRQWLGITLHFWSDDYRKIRCLYLACKEWNKCIIDAKLADAAITENTETELCTFDQSIDVGIQLVDDESETEQESHEESKVSNVDHSDKRELVKILELC